MSCTHPFLLSAIVCLAGSGLAAAQGEPAAAPLAAPAANAVPADTADDQRLIEAQDAWRKRDTVRLTQARDQLMAVRHPLAQWADYWVLNNRLKDAQQADLDSFYVRWPGSYVEDRLRNDWLLELGRRRDWTHFAIEQPRFRMNDDREVTCYSWWLKSQTDPASQSVRVPARQAWLAQRDADEGCQFMASQLLRTGVFMADDVWLKARTAVEARQSRAAKAALGLLDGGVGPAAAAAVDNPQRYLLCASRGGRGSRECRRGDAPLVLDADTPAGTHLVALALVRWAGSDPAAAAAALAETWQRSLDAAQASWAWLQIGKQGAMRLLPDAEGWFARGDAGAKAAGPLGDDEVLAWRARAALRATDAAHWQRLQAAIVAMSPAQQREAVWTYWQGRAQLATAAAGPAGQPQRQAGLAALERVAGQFEFYGKLASEELGRPQPLPPRPAPLTTAERAIVAQHPGLNRALALIALGLRSEGVREWNFALRDFSTDREFLAAAQRACEREVWDRCINTSERTRQEIDLAQRFPTPFRSDVLAAAHRAGLDPAFVYGLIRQESRFITDARSGVGASGLMQLMPGTAKWTARKVGLPFQAEQVTDRQTNLILGTSYLKLVLDDFDGSPALAAAAYNAGPGRPRRWREGPLLEVAAWAENIPFNETRDYVKKVLSNASYYAALLNDQRAVTLKPHLGPAVGPRPVTEAPPNPELP